MSSLPLDGDVEKTIADVHRGLAVLRTSLSESEKAWAACGFVNVKNPVARSLRRDIEEREALLQTLLHPARTTDLPHHE